MLSTGEVPYVLEHIKIYIAFSLFFLCSMSVTDGHVSESQDPTMAGRPHPGGLEATGRRM